MENLNKHFSLGGVSSENSKQPGTGGEEGSVRECLGSMCVCVCSYIVVQWLTYLNLPHDTNITDWNE